MSPDRTKRSRPARGKSLIPDPAPRHVARIVYVEAEGESTERDYCVALNNVFGSRAGFRIITPFKTTGSKPLEVAERAIRAASEVEEQSEYNADISEHPLHQVWAIFDRDEHPDVKSAYALLNSYNAKAAAKPGMVKVEIAFSNPSFDLWLLLHFQTVSSPQHGSNAWIHEKLRGHPGFAGFARETSRSKVLNEERAAQLMDPERIAAAVRNARSLLKECPMDGCSVTSGHADTCDPLRRDPSTDIWRFIESLGIDV
jgi:hypothetical protein